MAISEKKLDQWAAKHDISRLHKALGEYDYKIRLRAIAHLGSIKSRESVAHLEKLIDDPFLQVLRAAEKSIRLINPSHPSLKQFLEKIAEKEHMEERRTARTAEKFTPLTEEEERENLKKMAQKYDIRKIEQQRLKEERKLIVDWRIAMTILGILALIAWLIRFVL